MRMRPSSWAWRVTTWRDAEWSAACRQSGSSQIMRPSKRPWMKWENPLRRFARDEGMGSWMNLARDRGEWLNLTTAYADWYT